METDHGILTKSQQKRIAKRERIRAKYAREKSSSEVKKVRVDESHKWGQRQERNALIRSDYESNCDRGPIVVIDCGWDDGMMTDKETLSLTQQIMYSYSVNRKAKYPVRLCVYGASEKQMELLKKLPGFETWYMGLKTGVISDEAAIVDKGIYLTADSETILDIQPRSRDDILVIGGIVDRNRYKNATILKAEKIGMRSAQLPIGDSIKMKSSKVLAVNHVFQIVTEFMEYGDWNQALEKVIPDRKKIVEDILV